MTVPPSFDALVDIIADILIYVGKQKGSVVYLNGRKMRTWLGIDAGPIVLNSIHHALKTLGFGTIATSQYKYVVIPTKNRLSQIGLTHGKEALKAELRKLLRSP
jgi:hypothetical protein